ncbi:MAG TPA: flagellar hook-length control protein FliK, partial [Magnetospirillum sp.]|nr:flagellar hook-length control protein FliK [Magnetospirillum sp.]
VLPTQAAGTGAEQNASQDAGLAAAAPQPGSAAANAQQAPAAQAQPFDAILAAQVEATTGAQADAAAPQPQNNQPVAALNGVGATSAAQKAQAPQAAQAPRQPQLPQNQEVMDQVKVQIAKHGKDGDTIKVQLKPVELGAIEIKLDVAKDGTVSAVVTADNKDTLDLLKKDQSSLQKALEDAGLKADTGSMTFNLREGNQQQANQQQSTGSGMGRRRARLEAAAAADAASAKAAAAAQARWGMSRSGVDIQV